MNSNIPNYAWYALYTKPNQEEKIAEYLQKENIECYLPTTKRLKQWNDSQRWIDEPLFRSYLFVRVSYNEFFNVLNSQGVVCYAGLKGKPHIIPEFQIENIKTLVKFSNQEIKFTHNHIDKGLNAKFEIYRARQVHGELIQMCNESMFAIRIESINACLYTKISLDKVVLINHNSSELNGGQGQLNRYKKRKNVFETIDSDFY